MLIPAAEAKSDVFGSVSIAQHSQIANILASREFRKSADDAEPSISHNAIMDDVEDKNGGPNNLRAWRLYRKMKGAQLAKLLDITPGMVSDLENSNRALSAKWLRRIAPHLRTTPGLLLDHDPNDLDSDVIEIWVTAGLREKQQIAGAAKAIVKTGTEG